MRTRLTDEPREGRVSVHHHPELAIFQSQWTVSVPLSLGGKPPFFSFWRRRAGELRVDGSMLEVVVGEMERGSRPGWVFNVTILVPLPSQAL